MTSKQKGFSLLEILIAFALIGVGALGLVKLHSYIEQQAGYAVDSIKALRLAELQLEHYQRRAQDASGSTKLIPFDDLDTAYPHHKIYPKYCLGHHDELSTAGYDTAAALVKNKFALRCVITPAPGALSKSLQVITVTVPWKDRMGQDQKVTLKTMVSKYSEFD